MTSEPGSDIPGSLCAGIIIRRDFRALLERTNPEERRATGPSWIHFRAQDVRNPLVERPFNWFKSPLGHTMLTKLPRRGVGKHLHSGTSQRLATPLPIMTTPITNTTRTMIVTLFCTSHSRSVSNGPRVCDGATKLAITGTATVDVAIAVNPTMTTDA